MDRVLERVSVTLSGKGFEAHALRLNSIILRYQQVHIEDPVPPEELQALCDEVSAEFEDDSVARDAQDANGARSVLIEIMRRASYDWVLYRSSLRTEQRKLAEDAYIWLFLEEPGHPAWELRQAEGKGLTSFLSICDIFDVDPELIRSKVRRLTPQRVLMSGRPPTQPPDEEFDSPARAHVDLPPELELPNGFGSIMY